MSEAGANKLIGFSDCDRLNRLGNQRMAQVYPLLRQCVPYFRTVCQLLEEHVYKPMQAGERLGMVALKLSGMGSLQKRIEDAAQEANEQAARETTSNDGGEGDGEDENEGECPEINMYSV